MSFADPCRQHPALTFKPDPLSPLTVAQWCLKTATLVGLDSDWISFPIIQLRDVFLLLIPFVCLFRHFHRNGLYCIWRLQTSFKHFLCPDLWLLYRAFRHKLTFQWNFTRGTPRSRCVIHTQSNFLRLPQEQRNEIWGASSAGVPATLCSASERKT